MGNWVTEIHGDDAARQDLETDCLVDCGYTTFTGAYPTDWRTQLNKRIGVDHRTVVCLDPGGLDIQLTALVKDMRPLSQEREIEERQYKGGDLEMVLADPDEEFNPYRSGSTLDGEQWSGKDVVIGSWLVGTTKVLLQTKMKLREISAARGETTFLLWDTFYDGLFNYIRANEPAHKDLTQAGSSTFDLAYVTVFNTVAPIETWRITLTGSGDTFDVNGSISGYDGSGATGSTFNSTSGAIRITALAWGGTRAPGDVIVFDAVNAHENDNVVSVARDILLDETDMVAGDLDTASWTAIETQTSTFVLSRLEFRRRTKIIDALKYTLRHALITAFPSAEGKIKLATFLPTKAAGTYTWEDSICSGWNLRDLRTQNLDVYNVFTISYDPDDANTPALTRRYPLTGESNPSVTTYGFEREFPTLEMRGYAAGDESIIDRVLQEFYAYRSEQREIYHVQVTLEDLHRELNDIVYLSSENPTRAGYAVIVGVSKALPQKQIEFKLLEADWIISAGCGYGWCDLGHFTDSCWVTW